MNGIKVSFLHSRRTRYVMGLVFTAFAGYVLLALALQAHMRFWWLYLPAESPDWPMWVWYLWQYTSWVLPCAVAWAAAAFIGSVLFRLRPFPDCFLIALIVHGGLSLLALAGVQSDTWGYWLMVVVLVPLGGSLAAIGGGKIGAMVRKHRRPEAEAASAVPK